MSDIEIARQATMQPIGTIAEKLDIHERTARRVIEELLQLEEKRLSDS